MQSELLAIQVASAAKAAGLNVIAAESGQRYSGGATTRFTLGLATDAAKTETLELTEGFEFGRPDWMNGVKLYLAESAKRLHNPRPDCYVTLQGLPLSFRRFGWPFHPSTSGADTSLVHGEIKLEDGTDSLLHARIAASMTVTFREIVLAPEQPFAEGFIYNAVRKTMDQGQLELVKSGNRQPVPVTTRYYSTWRKAFTFNDTTAEQRQAFLAAKVYWLSGVLGGGGPVWTLDPRDAQYLNTTVEELAIAAAALVREGLIEGAKYASPTAGLIDRKLEYDGQLAATLQAIRPAFNEDMRSGLTNM